MQASTAVKCKRNILEYAKNAASLANSEQQSKSKQGNPQPLIKPNLGVVLSSHNRDAQHLIPDEKRVEHDRNLATQKTFIQLELIIRIRHNFLDRNPPNNTRAIVSLAHLE